MGMSVRKHLLRAVLAVFAVGTAVTQAEAGPIYFNAANGHYYTLTTGINNWVQAEAQAVSLGGHLVSITSLAEQNFIVSTFLSGSNSRALYWTGANDIASEGTWVWSNGDPFSFTFWNPGEPNNCACVPGGEDYGTINWHFWQGLSSTPGTWNDTSLTGIEFGPQPFGVTTGIIEFNSDPTAVPEPGSLVLLGTGCALMARRLRRNLKRDRART